MKIDSRNELEWQFDNDHQITQAESYPTAQAIANTYEIATAEHLASAGLDPLLAMESLLGQGARQCGLH